MSRDRRKSVVETNHPRLGVVRQCGRWMDNVMVERLWRSLKYKNVYLNAYETGTEARKGIGAWIDFYNAQRPHSSLDDLTPDEAYCGQPGPPVLQDRNTEAA